MGWESTSEAGGGKTANCRSACMWDLLELGSLHSPPRVPRPRACVICRQHRAPLQVGCVIAFPNTTTHKTIDTRKDTHTRGAKTPPTRPNSPEQYETRRLSPTSLEREVL
jgi:hypothetical protein